MTPSEQHHHSLSPEEKARLGTQYEMLMDIFAKRHGVTANELAEAVRWVKTHRDWMESIKKSGAFALIGFLASALLLALWEGLKQSIRKGG